MTNLPLPPLPDALGSRQATPPSQAALQQAALEEQFRRSANVAMQNAMSESLFVKTAAKALRLPPRPEPMVTEPSVSEFKTEGCDAETVEDALYWAGDDWLKHFGFEKEAKDGEI